MRVPTLTAVVERRLLVNYRADPEVVGRLLPPSLRPQVVAESAVVGICLIRLGAVAPVGVPATFGLHSENAAHRIAVEWKTPDGVASGVFIPRRDTDAWVNHAVGGRLFPGVHHRADFVVDEQRDAWRVALRSRDDDVRVEVECRATAAIGGELFGDAASASAFFRAGSVGYSPTRTGDGLEGLELRTDQWRAEPVEVVAARSSYFDDPGRFPVGSIELDCALLMRDIPVTWHEVSGPPPATLRTAVGRVS